MFEGTAFPHFAASRTRTYAPLLLFPPLSLRPSRSHRRRKGRITTLLSRCKGRTFIAMGGVARRSAVLYHYPCPDGAFAALAAHLYFSAASLPVSFFPNPVYNPIRAESFGPGEFDDIYLLDFTGPSGFVSEISTKVKSVTVLDHHKTSLELFSETSGGLNVSKIIDMERSGATIAYDYFKKKLSETFIVTGHGLDGLDAGPWGSLVHQTEVKRLEWLYKLIEDADLWKWALPHSKAFSSGLTDQNIDFNVNSNPNLFAELLALDPEITISKGQQTLLRKQKRIDEVLGQSYGISLGNGLFGSCLAVNVDASISDVRSELGNQLAVKSKSLNLRAIGAVVYYVPDLNNDELLKVSLRSIESEDTTVISQVYGGGGHRNASSFMMHAGEFERWKI